ncbi:MAG TPA: DoxX family protein [Myxococcaceae bacterium]|jgi:uncharacterized membrane protein YphA (DoxX/SURF4 family)
MRTTLYWIFTGLLAAVLVLGGVMDILRAPPVVQTIVALGYPTYVATLLGVWKLLGAAAVVSPGLPRLKEWAYAGIFFDLSGAAVSHAASGDLASKVAVPVVLLAIAAASWALRPASRRLGEVVPAVPAPAARPVTAHAA